MSVFLKSKRWLTSRVPYEIAGGYPLPADGWFREVNTSVGFDLLVPRTSTDINYIQLKPGDRSRSEQIGFKGGMQTIVGDKKSSVIHELMHALGFKHEQLHRKFPWNDNDPKVNKVDRMFSYQGKCKTEDNKKLYDEIRKTQGDPNSGGAKFFADNNLTSRVDALLDNYTEHWGDCDLDSIMMYSDFKKALQAAKMTDRPGVVATSRSNICDQLSAQDIRALKFWYAPPPQPPAPPRDFVVTFSGMPGQRVALRFSVRSTRQPSRVSNYTADPTGRAVVKGFNPDHAEIQVGPWPTWSRVRIDPGTSYTLPGGCTYSLKLA